MGLLKNYILEDVEAIRCEWWLGVEMVEILLLFFVSQDFMSSLFVTDASFWMVFW